MRKLHGFWSAAAAIGLAALAGCQNGDDGARTVRLASGEFAVVRETKASSAYVTQDGPSTFFGHVSVKGQRCTGRSEVHLQSVETRSNYVSKSFLAADGNYRGRPTKLKPGMYKVTLALCRRKAGEEVRQASIVSGSRALVKIGAGTNDLGLIDIRPGPFNVITGGKATAVQTGSTGRGRYVRIRGRLKGRGGDLPLDRRGRPILRS